MPSAGAQKRRSSTARSAKRPPSRGSTSLLWAQAPMTMRARTSPGAATARSSPSLPSLHHLCALPLLFTFLLHADNPVCTSLTCRSVDASSAFTPVKVPFRARLSPLQGSSTRCAGGPRGTLLLARSALARVPRQTSLGSGRGEMGDMMWFSLSAMDYDMVSSS